VNRGDVYWVDFPGPARRRPALILTRQLGLGVLTSVTVAPITTTARSTRTWVSVGPADGLSRPSSVNLDNLQTVDVARVQQFIAHLSPQKLAQVNSAARFALGL
jgi:mRNA interferase MazF